jgi:hypothetical protein
MKLSFGKRKQIAGTNRETTEVVDFVRDVTFENLVVLCDISQALWSLGFFQTYSRVQDSTQWHP